MTYEPIIRYTPIIVPIILIASLIAVTAYRPPTSSAPGVSLHDAARPQKEARYSGILHRQSDAPTRGERSDQEA
jgi:hypothetical protein